MQTGQGELANRRLQRSPACGKHQHDVELRSDFNPFDGAGTLGSLPNALWSVGVQRWPRTQDDLEAGIPAATTFRRLSVQRQSNSRGWLHRVFPRKRHQTRHLVDFACFLAKQVLSQLSYTLSCEKDDPCRDLLVRNKFRVARNSGLNRQRMAT